MDQADLGRAHRGMRAIGNAELAQDVLDVFFDRAWTQPQGESDLAVGLAAPDPREDFDFARSAHP
jgi:hypothetical protein